MHFPFERHFQRFQITLKVKIYCDKNFCLFLSKIFGGRLSPLKNALGFTRAFVLL